MRDRAGILYYGPSMLDGAPIVVVGTMPKPGNSNRKTGAVLQTYILRADRDPTFAARYGLDSSVCGDCPLAGRRDGTLQGRPCYVNLGHGPRGVWTAYRAGNYPPVSDLASFGEGRTVRLGTYGDPAAAPFVVWERLLSKAQGWTGYTHQWGEPSFDPRILRYCMLSCEGGNREEAARLHPGALAFTVRPKGAPVPRGTVQCPAANEAPTYGRATCSTCLLCGGSEGRGRRDVSIAAHGSGAAYV